MDNDEQRKELVESITEWFEAGVVHTREKAEQRYQIDSISTYSSYSSYNDY